MNDILVTDARTGETLPGIPTPRLISEGGGKAYFVPSDTDVWLSGVWYLCVPGQYEDPYGEYTQVRIRIVDRDPSV